MAEYYDYVAESANDQINWGEIGKNISDMLNKQVEQRDQRREEINTATNDIVKTLNDTTILGQDQNANAWWQEGAGQLQDYLLMQNRLWKNGQLDNVTYKRNIENTKNNTDQLINIFNNYNKLNDARVKKAQAGGVSGQGMFVHDNLSQYANLNNTKLYINPSDGNMVLSQKVDKNGQIVADNNPNGIKTIAALTSAMSTEYNPYDLDKGLATPVKDFGKMVLTQIGGLAGYSSPEDVKSKISDIRQSPSFKQAQENIINKIMLMPDDVSSIYSDVVNSGVDFKDLFTYDPNDKDPNKVLLKLNANGRYEADFSGEKGEQQKTKVRNAIRTRLDTMLDKEISSDFDPLLANIANMNAQTNAANAETRRRKVQTDIEKQDNKTRTEEDKKNSKQLFGSAVRYETKKITDADGNEKQVNSITPMNEVFEEQVKSKGPLYGFSTVFNEIKKGGKSFGDAQVESLGDDSNGRWVVRVSIPNVITNKDKTSNEMVVIHEPVTQQDWEKLNTIMANMYNAVVTDNNVTSSDVISGKLLNFKFKNQTAQPEQQQTTQIPQGASAEFND